MKLIRLIGLALLVCPAVQAAGLLNGDFEQAGAQGRPIGWNVLSGLDEAVYGESDRPFRFDAVIPVGASPGRGLRGRALVFPAEGTWQCEVSHHDRGRIGGEVVETPGSRRGKAAVYQQLTLQPGTYRFSAYLRTAGGDCWSGAFSLGVSTCGTTQYAHDDRTGIRWTAHDLAMRGDPEGLWPVWGEWQKQATAPFTLEQPATITVWIRFNYVNRHGTRVRWEVDDAAVEAVRSGPTAPSAPRRITTSRSIELGRHDDFVMELNAGRARDTGRVIVNFHQPDGSSLVIGDGEVSFRTGGYRVVRGYRFAGRNAGEERRVKVVVQGACCRVTLPGAHGFELPLLGGTTGNMDIEIEHDNAADLQLTLSDAPDDSMDLPVPEAGAFERVYDPSVDGKSWYINDHCVVPGPEGLWHMFGITHAEPFSPLDEDFFAHAVTPNLLKRPWQRRPYACPVNTEKGETHVWAPHIVRKGDTYYMFYCGGGEDGDEYRINLRTSTDLRDWRWHDGNPLFTGIGNVRDPMVLKLGEDDYLMYTTEPWDDKNRYSAVTVRASRDLLHWGEPSPALILPGKDTFARRSESPFVFHCGGAYYLSVTGVRGGYRDTRIWRSVDPRRFRREMVVARLDAHAPEWLAAASPRDVAADGSPIECPSFVTHCGWRQGGLFLAPVEWTPGTRVPMGYLRLVGDAASRDIIEIRRRGEDREPYIVIGGSGDRSGAIVDGGCFLPAGRYQLSRSGGGERREIEVVEAAMTSLPSDR